jgi:nucleotide-binding universal stress UspA family protein
VWRVSPSRLLVVTTGPVDEAVLRAEVAKELGGEEAEIKVVAPASGVSPLRWLASDEDQAREEAGDAVRKASEAAEAGGDVVEAEVGDPDPVQAIEDALRTFPADELLLVTHRGAEATWLEKGAPQEAFERFDIPVTHFVLPE